MKIPSGTKVLDILLEGGFEEDVVTTLYGPSGSGKTNICLFAAIETAKTGKKVIFIDTEGGFSIERIQQIVPDSEKIMQNILVLQPMFFEEQKKIFSKFNDMIKSNTGLIVIDTVGMLYRLELTNKEGISEINNELGKQVAILNRVARKHKIPVLVSNQVYSSFDARDKIQLVGGDLLKYGSKCLIELQLTPSKKRKAVLRKHRNIAEGKEIYFEIKDTSLVQIPQRGFRLF